jgi:N-acetylglucosaminyl-diphospho-decaprenol L-rhamnosyltransferase
VTGQERRRATPSVAALVVDYDAGDVLLDCITSLLDEGVRVVVVENGDPAPPSGARAAAGLDGRVPLLATGKNLGYGAGANRGAAAVDEADYFLVCNPDLVVHAGAIAEMVAMAEAQPSLAIVGPRILTPEGAIYPSVRRFPSLLDAAGHAALGLFAPNNPFSKRYRTPEGVDSPRGADWVSGACFLVRRSAFEELGGFDETYFMFSEDMDICWRAHQAGWGVGVEPAAVVTHLEGVSRRRHPYAMLVAHHRSALQFANRTTTGWRRVLLPGAALILGVRLLAACGRQALGRPA